MDVASIKRDIRALRDEAESVYGNKSLSGRERLKQLEAIDDKISAKASELHLGEQRRRFAGLDSERPRGDEGHQDQAASCVTHGLLFPQRLTRHRP